MEKILLSLVVGMMWQPKIFVLWSVFHTISPKPTPIPCAIYCDSQHHRIAHAGRELGMSLLQPPARSRLALRSDKAAQGFSQLSLENLLGCSVGSCPKTLVTFTCGRDRGRKGAKSQKGLGPYRVLTEPGAKAWSLVLKSREANKLFHKHCFYVAPNISRSNTCMQPFTAGRSLPGKCSHVMVKKTISWLWCQSHSGTFSLWLCWEKLSTLKQTRFCINLATWLCWMRSGLWLLACDGGAMPQKREDKRCCCLAIIPLSNELQVVWVCGWFKIRSHAGLAVLSAHLCLQHAVLMKVTLIFS